MRKRITWMTERYNRPRCYTDNPLEVINTRVSSITVVTIEVTRHGHEFLSGAISLLYLPLRRRRFLLFRRARGRAA